MIQLFELLLSFIKVGDCVMPREGVFAKVIKSGNIKLNDKIIVECTNNQN